MRVRTLRPTANKDVEEKNVSKQGKDDLEKLIVREAKSGWQVKARSHDSEGTHGAILFRKVGQHISDIHAPVTPPANDETLDTSVELY